MRHRLEQWAGRTASPDGYWRYWGSCPCEICLGLSNPLLGLSLFGLGPKSLGLIIQCLDAGLFGGEGLLDNFSYQHVVFTSVAAALRPQGLRGERCPQRSWTAVQTAIGQDALGLGLALMASLRAGAKAASFARRGPSGPPVKNAYRQHPWVVSFQRTPLVPKSCL